MEDYMNMDFSMTPGPPIPVHEDREDELIVEEEEEEDEEDELDEDFDEKSTFMKLREFFQSTWIIWAVLA